MKLHDDEIRQYARIGALDMARQAVAEFPDILPELNRMAHANGTVPPYSVRKQLREATLAAGRGPLGDEQKRTQVLDDERVARVPAKRHVSAKTRRALSLSMKRRWAASRRDGAK